MELDTLLMTPGPVQVSSDILLAGASPLKHHRTTDFSPVYEECIKLLKKFLYTSNELFLTTSSGTGGMETAIVNLFNPEETILTVETGVFGERFNQIAKAYNIKTVSLVCDEGKRVRVEQIKNALKEHPEITGVTVTFNETSTGIKNDIEEIGNYLKEKDVLFITDGVSGIGALPFRMDEWHVDVAISASQKGFLSPPGVGIIALSEKAMKKLDSVVCRGFYFDLKQYQKSQNLKIPCYPWTPAISVMFSFLEALRKIDRIGIENLHRHNKKLATGLRASLKALGLKLFTEESACSDVLTVFHAPEGIKPADIVSEIRNKYAVLIAGGHGKFSEFLLRITTIGTIGERDIIGTVGLLEIVLFQKGYLKELGKGVSAALKTFVEFEKGKNG